MYNFNSKKFAKDIIEKRTKDGTSIRQAAAEIGTPFRNVYRAETGVAPNVQNFFLICQWLGYEMTFYFKTEAFKKTTKKKK